VVAVDGPAGSGKSSVCRGVAQALGLRYLDTGAMYRAMTWAVLQAGISPDDAERVAQFAGSPIIESGTDPSAPTICVDGVDVAGPIREADVTAAVSAVSAVPLVRTRLVELQRMQAAAAINAGQGIVLEGRDIGSVVLPDADLKVFLTADPIERARRRAGEQPGGGATITQVEASLVQRDEKDASRATSPMLQAEGAQMLDTTDLTLGQVIDEVCALVRQASAGVSR
jgi:cytidylate kinase